MSNNNDVFLEVRNLSNEYITRHLGLFGKKEIKPVLSSLNMQIHNGEIFGLVGESGCGKSTLAKCILGLIDYKGEILVRGSIHGKKPSFKDRQKRAFDVQAVFQDPSASLNPVKSIGWILEEPLRAHGIGTRAEREYQADHMLELVGLNSTYRRRKPAELSSGQKQRISIGAALMLKPGLLIADEPVSALDVSVGAQILNLFRELNRNLNLALLFISHNMELVHYLCDSIALMENGSIKTKYRDYEAN